MSRKLLFVVNTDSFFLSHRLPIAQAAQKDGYRVYVASTDTGSATVVESYGIGWLPLSLNRSSLGLGSNTYTLLQLIRIFRLVRPDLVHLVTIKPVVFGAIAARVTRVRSVVVAVSGMGFVYGNRGMRAALVRCLISFFYKCGLAHPNLKVIFQNNADIQTLSRIVPSIKQSMALIPGSGVNLDEFCSSPIPQKPLIVVMASRLLIDKGVREFVRAAALLQPLHPQVRFVLVGQRDPDNPASVSEYELQGWVDQQAIEYWGQCDDMPHVFRQSSIVVLPSYYREGLPKVLIEAAASGRPIITTNVPGCSDAIVPNETGLLVPARNHQALADGIERLIKNAGLRNKMGAAGRKFAEHRFDVEHVVASHMQIYQELDHLCALP